MCLQMGVSLTQSPTKQCCITILLKKCEVFFNGFTMSYRDFNCHTPYVLSKCNNIENGSLSSLWFSNFIAIILDRIGLNCYFGSQIQL